ncbi:Benzoyl-CoA reductase/2-hydroxyglutaryl-CoA dehydratase subunit, BcrC/BadD/HgdB [Lachnospiraceae bacterium XBB1006]|nr:Benzoyl-CoA reductase/2-hydroxyglutaryl-CoA dehydratase subunit, BcrC/BadD/HgdB [Lachnospiraceae bacterium XBB1006]
MKDLQHLQFFENLLQISYNDLVRKAKEEGQHCVGFMCENTPEPLFNLGNCFGVRLFAPNTGSLDIATYYMTSFLCETTRAIFERSMEGGFHFLDCLIAPDGCTMMNRCAENIELRKAIRSEEERFFYENMEIPLKADENGVALMVRQCNNHILEPLKQRYGVDTSDAAIRKAVAEHNVICRLIQQIGEFRKEAYPRITGYEFAVLTLATYVCPKGALVEKLQETLKEVQNRKPEEKPYRARLVVVGSEMDDPEYIKLIEECGAFVCADRYCFGSLPGRKEIVLTNEEDALTQVCRHYVYECQCPRQMNMEKFYGRKAYVDEVAKTYHADGIIYNQVKFCDPWAYERATGSQALREEYGYPVLSVDRPYNIRSSAGQMRTRVQAFIESIEIKKLRKETEK